MGLCNGKYVFADPAQTHSSSQSYLEPPQYSRHNKITVFMNAVENLKYNEESLDAILKNLDYHNLVEIRSKILNKLLETNNLAPKIFNRLGNILELVNIYIKKKKQPLISLPPPPAQNRNVNTPLIPPRSHSYNHTNHSNHSNNTNYNSCINDRQVGINSYNSSNTNVSYNNYPSAPSYNN